MSACPIGGEVTRVRERPDRGVSVSWPSLEPGMTIGAIVVEADGGLMGTSEHTVVGNRLMLVGAVVYLLEWVVIVPYAGHVLETADLSPTEAAEQYADEADGAAIMAGWFSVVLLGRIALAAGLRGALRQAPRQMPLMDFAVGAMVVSVVLEITAFAMGAGAGWLADNGADPSTVVALDAGGAMLYQLVFGPLAVF